MKKISLDITNAKSFVKDEVFAEMQQKAKEAQKSLEAGTCPGNDFLGHVDSLYGFTIGRLRLRKLRQHYALAVLAFGKMLPQFLRDKRHERM